MRILDLNLRNESGLVRVEAKVIREESDQPPFALFFETDQRFQESIWPDPNAFLAACVLPAWRDGETRVHLDTAICPVLSRNLKAVLAVLGCWYPELGTPPVIEAKDGFCVRRPSQGGAVSLLSCGIDSLATLRWNKLHLPPDHPSAIKAVIFVDYHRDPSTSGGEWTERVSARLPVVSAVAADAGVDVIPVITNMWWLVDDGYFYDEKWHGAALGAAAAFFSRQFAKAFIASSYDAAQLHPWGSHPLTDPLYTSAHFQIEHDGFGMSRMEKTALVAGWPAGLHHIRVCQKENSGRANCGKCEKCIRTMTALVALGKLKECQAFSENNVSPRLLASVDTEHRMIRTESDAAWYRELVPALVTAGREDLAAVIGSFCSVDLGTKLNH